MIHVRFCYSFIFESVFSKPRLRMGSSTESYWPLQTGSVGSKHFSSAWSIQRRSNWFDSTETKISFKIRKCNAFSSPTRSFAADVEITRVAETKMKLPPIRSLWQEVKSNSFSNATRTVWRTLAIRVKHEGFRSPFQSHHQSWIQSLFFASPKTCLFTTIQSLEENLYLSKFRNKYPVMDGQLLLLRSRLLPRPKDGPTVVKQLS